LATMYAVETHAILIERRAEIPHHVRNRGRHDARVEHSSTPTSETGDRDQVFEPIPILRYPGSAGGNH